MNARAELPTLCLAAGKRAADVGTADHRAATVWIEVQDLEGQCTASLRIQSLPATLWFGAPQGDACSGSAKPRSAVVLTQTGTDNGSPALRAQPLNGCRARFNGGPLTSLGHDFDTWATIEFSNQRFRVSNHAWQTSGDSGGAGTAAQPSAWTQTMRQVNTIGGLAVVVFGVLVGLACIALADWFANTGQTSYWDVLARQKGRLFDLAVWWGAWCLGTRLSWGQLRWFEHVRVLAIAALTYGAAKVSLPFGFAAAGFAMPALLAETGWVLLASGAALAHIAVVPARRAVRNRLRAGVAAAVVALMTGPLMQWAQAGPPGPAVSASLPVAFGLDRPTARTDALAALPALKAEVDRARQVPP